MKTLSSWAYPCLYVVSMLAILYAFIHAFSFFMILLLWPVGTYQCSTEAESFEHRYLFIAAECQVRIDGKWINWDKANAVFLENASEH